jgi:hypothetical protein
VTDVRDDRDAPAGDDGPRHLAPAAPAGRTAGIDRRLIVVAAALVVVVAAGAVLLLRSGGDGAGDGGPPAEEVVDLDDVAAVAPRLLVTADGWSVASADQLDLAYGEMTSAGPSGEITLMWTTDGREGAPTHDETLADLEGRAERLPDATIAGETAAVFRADPVFHAPWRQDDYSVGAVGRFATIDDFLAVTATVEAVGVEDWLAALPETADPAAPGSGSASAGDPAQELEALRTADDVLDGVPLPAGLDATTAAAAASGAPADDPYQLGLAVLRPVACGWYDEWARALAAGDTVAAGEAADALGTSPGWLALQAMSTAGEWPVQVWDLASAVAGNTTPAAPDAFTQAAAATACPG